MLTQQSKGCLGDRERIGRVDPEFREGGGVGCLVSGIVIDPRQDERGSS